MIDLEFRSEGGETLWTSVGEYSPVIAFGLNTGDVVLIPGDATRYLVLDKWVKLALEGAWVVITLIKEPDE